MQIPTQNKRGYLFVISLQLFIILILLLNILLKSNPDILGIRQSVYPIEAKDYNFPPSTSLKYFYEPKPNSQRTDSREWLPYKRTYKFNNEGFRSFADFDINKPQNVFRIITLGDSHTFGAYVDILENYPSRLETTLNKNCLNKKFEVINLGVPGYDITYAIEHFLQRGQKYSPDLVIWLIKEDDIFQINDLIREYSFQIWKELNESGKLKTFQAAGNFYPHRTIAQDKLKSDLGEEKILSIQKQNLEKFSSIYSGRLLIFTYNYRLSSYNTLLEDYSKKRPLTYYDNQLPLFNPKDQQLVDGHPNARGYQLISNHLFNLIKSHQIIPCRT